MMSPKEIGTLLEASYYVADDSLATLVWMALALDRPVLLEGEAGVGKTAIAQALSGALNRPLFRLQCHESLDLNQAVYEWNYSKQLLEIRLREAENEGTKDLRQDLFSESFLLKRPLMQAITSDVPAVLLIDEVDRADESFEAYLLEVLGEFQISVPELGTIKATTQPIVILTSNGTRDLSDALRRRCLYHYVDYPTLPREIEIVKKLVPRRINYWCSKRWCLFNNLENKTWKKSPALPKHWTGSVCCARWGRRVCQTIPTPCAPVCLLC